jgi:hypothetical protein
MSSQTLGTGAILDSGEIVFTPFSHKFTLPNDQYISKMMCSCSSTVSMTNTSTTSSEDYDEMSEDTLSEGSSSQTQDRQMLISNTPLTNNARREKFKKTYFIRSSDLGLEAISYPGYTDDKQNCHEYRPSPLPSLDDGSDELWVAINETCDSQSLIFPHAISSLMEMAMDQITDSSTWVLERRSERILRSISLNEDYKFRTRGPALIPSVLSEVLEKETLVWTTPDNDAYRSEGIIQQSPKVIFDLLMDSARVKEYNNSSEGRTDVCHFFPPSSNSGKGDKEVTTKVVAGTNRVPLIRLSIPFMTLFHGQPLDGDSSKGYIILNRSVKEIDVDGKVSSAGSQCETVVGATLILSTQQDGQKEPHPKQSLVINMNRVKVNNAIKIPKAIGVRGAIGFFNGMRSASY